MNGSSLKTSRPDVDRYAVPVSVADGGATGFLGRRAGRVGLYTAAHNLHMAKPRTNTWAIDEWRWLMPTLYVHPTIDDPGPRPGLSVYSAVEAAGGNEERTPLFSWLEPHVGMVKDAVRFDLTNHNELLAACVERFHVVDLDAAAHHLHEGERFTCVGMPGWADSARTWPYSPPERRESHFVRVEGDGHIKATGRSEDGFSGAPVFCDDGRFAGMHVGENRGVDRGLVFEHVRLISPRDLADL